MTVSKTLLPVAVFQPEIIPQQKTPRIPLPEGHLDLRQPPRRWRALQQPSVRLIYQSHYAFSICSQIHLLDLGLVLWKEKNSAAGVHNAQNNLRLIPCRWSCTSPHGNGHSVTKIRTSCKPKGRGKPVIAISTSKANDGRAPEPGKSCQGPPLDDQKKLTALNDPA